MLIVLIFLVGAVLWLSLLVGVMALCKAAKAGDEALGPLSREKPAAATCGSGLGGEDLEDVLGLQLAARRRPTHAQTFASRTAEAPSAATEPRLSLSEAAIALGVEPEALLAWEARYHYPISDRSATAAPGTYSNSEVNALATALQRGLSVTAAIEAAMTVTVPGFATVPIPPARRMLDAS